MVNNKDACELLDADHLAVKHLFVEYARLAMVAAGPQAAASGGDERLQLARKICDELTVHAQIEEEIFYPALQEAAADSADQVGEAHAEHQDAKELIARIKAMPSVDDALDDLVSQLARAVEHHVKEERDGLFPKARASGLDLAALGARLRKRQQALETEPATVA